MEHSCDSSRNRFIKFMTSLLYSRQPCPLLFYFLLHGFTAARLETSERRRCDFKSAPRSAQMVCAFIERLSVGSLTPKLISNRNYAQSHKQRTSSLRFAVLNWNVCPCACHSSLLLISFVCFHFSSVFMPVHKNVLCTSRSYLHHR